MTQSAEVRAIKLLRPSDVHNVEQLSTGTFLDCANGYQWLGGIRASLRSGVAGETALDLLAERAADSGFTVTRDKVLTGGTRYQLVDRRGVQLLATLYDKNTLVDVGSASPCFVALKGFHPPGSY